MQLPSAAFQPLPFYLSLHFSHREKQNAGPCQTCLAMPEIGNAELSYSGTSWEKICPVHHCPIPASPGLGEDNLPSSSHTLGPVSTQSNGQVPASCQDSQQQHPYYPCSQEESRGSYGLPSLPGHGERPVLCSHLSSGDLEAASHPEASETPWKQWSPGQRRPVQHHVVTVRHDKAFRMPKSYSQLLAEWPLAVLLLCSVAAAVCSVAGLLLGNLPDFAQPLMGFEPRDTDIGRKLIVWRNIESHTGYKKTLSLSPYAKKKSYDDLGIGRGQKAAQGEQAARTRRMVETSYGADGFFCGPPEKSYSQLVFMSTTAGSLWNLQAIQSMCQMEQDKIRSHVHFRDLCQRTEANECCPSWSLGNYIAVLYNRSSCLEITQGDISHTLALLRACAPDYHRGVLTPSCIGPEAARQKHSQCAQVPEKCTRFNAIYQLLHFLVDRDFLSPQTMEYQVPSLKYSLLFLPTRKGASMMGIYLDNLETWDLFDNYTSITGMDLGLKQKLFQHYLLLDTKYPVLAILAIFLSISFYLRSVFITLMVLLAVVSSLMISYFLYKVAFRFTYFPFVNLTAVIILSSICANHTFVFFDLWNLSKSQNPSAGLAQWVSQTMHHFAYLMLASCFTTGAAFYASYISNITAIRCFAVYMGTSVLVNLVFMMTWLPSSAVLYERYITTTCVYKPEAYWNNSSHKRVALSVHYILRALQNTLSETSKLLFEKLLPCGVIKFRYIWICWFAALAIGGAYISCSNPKLKLPTLETSSVQVFRLSHPFERYDSEYCHQFMFERLEHGEGQRMPVTIVWGILPVDNGDHFNPKSNGTLVTDTTFTIQNPDAQKWLLEFCQKVKNRTFYYPDAEQKSTVCFMEEFLRWMNSRQCSQRDHSFNLCCTVLVTTGLLVLLEWQLNAVESLFISAAVGLSVDFTVNYCISYHLCPHSDRLSRVAFSLKQMSCATAMAASALFSAGVIMLPAMVLAYRKLGIFIMMINCISCGFASLFFQSLCCFFGPEKNCGQILWPCAHTMKDYSDDSGPNGNFACGGSEKQNRLRKVQESNTANEQYELQPLSRKLSDSFDNSTSTSKLSNRPSVLSEDIQVEDNRCPRVGTHPSVERERQSLQDPLGDQQISLCQCPALQTSSPYKHSTSETEIHRERLCRDCRCQKYGLKAWDGSGLEHIQPAGMKEEGQLNKSQCSSDTAQQQSDYTSDHSPLPAADIYKIHRCLCSLGSSFDMLNISSETSISDFEQGLKLAESASSCPDALELSDSYGTERGYLNGKRDTLRLDLRETVFDVSPAASQQNSSSWKNRFGVGNEGPVVLPNSQPDMPDVWIKRSSAQSSGYNS
uniref:Dispatched RND transporter family member 2 n=1 Tax=Zonotrichia albicollis TaxID=44394 RepID=A0A8D2ME32_ZONAL